MSLEARYNTHYSEKTLAKAANLDSLYSVATAAGHGYSQYGLNLNAGWTEVQFDEANVRPSYDLNHIHTFSPELVKFLLFEVSERRQVTDTAMDALLRILAHPERASEIANEALTVMAERIRPFRTR